MRSFLAPLFVTIMVVLSLSGFSANASVCYKNRYDNNNLVPQDINFLQWAFGWTGIAGLDQIDCPQQIKTLIEPVKGYKTENSKFNGVATP